jgi:tetratricopeptide (TPR) repeat protein
MMQHRRFACIAALLVLVSPLGAQSAAFEEGVKLIREGRFDQARVKLEEAHRLAPGNAVIENLLGITETKLGNIDEANRDYRNAIRIQPSLAAAHKNLGFNLLTARDFSNAEPELREALRLDPGDEFVHYYLALLALGTGHDAEALGQASHAASLIENDPDADAGLVEAEIRLGHSDAALSRITSMETANQLSSAREYPIAVLLTQHSYYHQALHCFQRIASIDPSWENRYNLALAMLYDQQPAEAATLLAALHAERPAHADTLMFLGSAFEMQQKMPEALEAYRAALIADPSNPDRTLDYTRLLMDMDRYDEAIQIVQAGVGDTSSTALRLRLGAVEMIKGDYPAARDAFHTALAADPTLDAAYVGLAQTEARQGSDVNAIHILEEARHTLPNHYPLEYYFGLLASRMGREQEAIVAFENATRLQPSSPDPFFELGKVYSSQQNWLQAQKALERVIELNSQFVPAHYQLSRVYSHLGLSSKAESEVQQTRTLVDTQRDQALRKQRERGASFQPRTDAAPSPLP